MAVYKMNHRELFSFGVWFEVSRSLQVDFWEMSFFKDISMRECLVIFFLALVSVMGKHLLHMISSSVQITRREQGGKLSAPLSAPISHDRRNECNLFA